MRRILIRIAIMLVVFQVLGTIAGLVICLGIPLFLRYTSLGRRVRAKTMQGFMIWKYEKLAPWFKEHKTSRFFKFFENANWFPWYGRKVLKVKSRNPSKLSATEKDVVDAIKAKDYQKALDIVLKLPQTVKTTSLKQIIEAKLK